MITLETGDTVQGVASVAAKLTTTIFGGEVLASGAQRYKCLYQGQLPITTPIALYTVPADAVSALISLIIVRNTDSSARTFNLFRGGAVAANEIDASSIPAGGKAIFSGGQWAVFDSSGVLQISGGGGGGSLTDHTHAATGSGANGGGATLSPVTLNLPSSASPTPTAEGQIAWDTDDDVVRIGDGAATKTLMNDVLTTRGDMIRRSATVPQRFAVGSARQRLTSDGTDPVWSSASGCEVSRASQNIANTATDPISFTDADTTDTDAYHDPASNASRIVAPFTGRYLVTATVHHESDTSTTGGRRGYIDKNTGGTHALGSMLATAAIAAGTGSGTGGLSMAWSGRLTAGDYVEVFYNQSSGATRTCAAKASMEFLGP